MMARGADGADAEEDDSRWPRDEDEDLKEWSSALVADDAASAARRRGRRASFSASSAARLASFSASSAARRLARRRALLVALGRGGDARLAPLALAVDLAPQQLGAALVALPELRVELRVHLRDASVGRAPRELLARGHHLARRLLSLAAELREFLLVLREETATGKGGEGRPRESVRCVRCVDG